MLPNDKWLMTSHVNHIGYMMSYANTGIGNGRKWTNWFKTDEIYSWQWDFDNDGLVGYDVDNYNKGHM